MKICYRAWHSLLQSLGACLGAATPSPCLYGSVTYVNYVSIRTRYWIGSVPSLEERMRLSETGRKGLSNVTYRNASLSNWTRVSSFSVLTLVEKEHSGRQNQIPHPQTTSFLLYMCTGTCCVVANGKCWPSLQQVRAGRFHQSVQVCPVAGGEREQLEPKYLTTRVSLKYSFDFLKIKFLVQSVSFLLSFVSSSAHRMLKLEQNYHNTRESTECQVCCVDSAWVTQWGGCYFPPLLHQFVCLCMCTCMHVGVRPCMSVYCALCLETNPVKACLR